MTGVQFTDLRVLYHSTRRSPDREPHFRYSNDTAQFELGERRYIAWPSVQTSAILPQFDLASLVTVISASEGSFPDSAWLKSLISRQRVDDVFDLAFLRGIIFIDSKEPEGEAATKLEGLLESWGTAWSKHMTKDFPIQPPPGLYVWKDNALWSAYRVYDDFNGAFTASIRRCPSTGKYTNLSLGGKEYQTLGVIVPSRIGASPSQIRPLEGLRFAVKDMYRIKGLRNTLGNRAFYDVNEPATVTSPAIQRLLDSGAYLVGMTKLACFAGREEPTESVDYQAPYNPRGDGYQSPAGSSSGSAAAIASYEFLDFAIGSDTTGSTRRPAFFNGCFALRPSHDRLPLDGMQLTFELFDIPSLFSCDIGKFKDVAITWIGPDQFKGIQKKKKFKPPLLVYPLDYLPTASPEQMKLLDSFVSDLELTVGTKAWKISIKESWFKSGPVEAGGQSIDEFFDEVATHSFLFDFYYNFESFRNEYYKKHQKAPYINPFTKWRWDLGKSITQSQRDEAIRKMKIYKKWILKEVLREGERDALMILPIAEAAPNYRDTQPGAPFKQNAFDALFLAPILGAPELVVPIGQLPYHSRISRRVEQLPVALSVLGLPGTDINLIEIVERCLKETGRHTVVQTGSIMFND